MSNNYDIIIIGAGIIGTATAYKLSLKNESLKIAVIDKESKPNEHQTGRNSGVIHSGVYYPKGSLKSENCINGYNQLVHFLNEYEIEYKLTGKLIAAANESEYEELQRLYKNAEDVGLEVSYLDKKEIKEIDKNLVAPKGFLVKETGITDYKKVLKKFIDISTEKKVDYFFDQQIGRVITDADIIQIETQDKKFKTEHLINCAGLQCDRVFELTTNKKSPVTILPFKGEYFKVPGNYYKSDILVYPVPKRDFPFLGIHLTRMIDGSLKVGPNAVLSFEREGYDGINFSFKDGFEIIKNKALYKLAKNYGITVIKEFLKYSSATYFEKNVKKYWSKFDKQSIIGYSCGIRAQATEKGKLLNDFKIERVGTQIHVLNAPSPAATSCLSIADTIISQIYK